MPVSRTTLLTDLKRWVTRFEDDLRQQCKDVPALDARLKAQYKQAKDAGRTAFAYAVWRDGELTQSAVGWVLSCVFVRFLEDNDLLERPFLSGVGEGRDIAAETKIEWVRQTGKGQSDNDYLAHVMSEVGRLPGMADLMDARHNALWNAAISPDAAKSFIEFWRRIDPGTGKMAHEFTDPDWDTRFLGDLYQDLSESARKKFALLQTPDFVEEFILDRTLDPAINTFGLKVVRMIDPTCGSGHFVLGGFRRLLALWGKKRPDLSDKEHAVKALDGVFGVDINPFAVAIARFRLLLAAWRYCEVKRLRSAPDFKVNLAVGDSLLHGARFDAEGNPFIVTRDDMFGGSEAVFKDETAHHFEVEDAKELHRILGQQYHVVVGNPPYITVRDPGLKRLYKARYDSCHGRWVLSIPFFERFFDLAIVGKASDGTPPGFVGKITSNSFMKREFATKFVKTFIPRWDLSHVIDTSGAYLPGHGTPTVVIFGRNQRPRTELFRLLIGLAGEPTTPEDPSLGKVWAAIKSQADCASSESDFIRSADTPRTVIHSHPWILSDLARSWNSEFKHKLGSDVKAVGITAVTGEDIVYVHEGRESISRMRFDESMLLVEGDANRDWESKTKQFAAWVYNDSFEVKVLGDLPGTAKVLWPFRANLSRRKRFGTPMIQRGLKWFEWQELYAAKLQVPLSITFAFVATHNHFVLGVGDCVYKQTAPVIKLRRSDDVQEHIRILGILNSSAACFWMKQVFQCRGSTVDERGARQTTTPFEDFYDLDSTKIKQFPVPPLKGRELATAIQSSAYELAKNSPDAALDLWSRKGSKLEDVLDAAETTCESHRRKMIAWQEELDWQMYEAYGLIEKDSGLAIEGSTAVNITPAHGLQLGERTFEISMARQMVRGTFDTTWFERHKESGSRPITAPPEDWPAEYMELYHRRHLAIQENKNLNLIERPEFKRRWNTEPWAKRQQAALEKWLLTRLETYFHDADRMVSGEDEAATAAKLAHIRPLRARFAGGGEPRLVSVRQLAQTAQADSQWMEAATVFAGRADFDVPHLVENLVLAESVPALPADRYKPTGMRHRIEWEKTWELQREEDRIDAERQSLEDGIDRRVQLVVEEQHAYRLEQLAGK